MGYAAPGSLPLGRHYRGAPGPVLASVGTSVAMFSYDKGATWAAATIAAQNWRGMCYSAFRKKFVAVANTGVDRIATAPASPSVWTVVAGSGANGGYKCVAYSPPLDLFCALSNNLADATQLLTSADGGATWVPRVMIASRTWDDIIWDPFNALFVAVNHTNGSAIATSPDGINFTLRVTPGTSHGSGLCQSSVTGRILFVNGDGGDGAFSDNAIAWTAVATGAVSTFECGAHGSVFATMFPGTLAGPFRSTDNALNFFNAAALPVDNNFQAMCFAPQAGAFVAVALGGGTGPATQRAIFSTNDALTYSIGTTPAGVYNDVCEGGT